MHRVVAAHSGALEQLLLAVTCSAFLPQSRTSARVPKSSVASLGCCMNLLILNLGQPPGPLPFSRGSHLKGLSCHVPATPDYPVGCPNFILWVPVQTSALNCGIQGEAIFAEPHTANQAACLCLSSFPRTTCCF